MSKRKEKVKRKREMPIVCMREERRDDHVEGKAEVDERKVKDMEITDRKKIGRM